LINQAYNPLLIKCTNNYQNINCSADTNGGVLYANELATVDSIDNCRFESNQADNGGAISIDSNAVITSITTSTFVSNIATNKGGGIELFSFERATIRNISASVFENNTAQEAGGSIMITWAGMGVVSECEFVNNSAKGGDGGGAIAISGEGGM
jgi:predicted outer membrane repeat protein